MIISIKSVQVGLLLALAAASQIGCRACCSPHDYDPPVANCPSCGCGGRSGSAAGGVVTQGYVTEGPAVQGEPSPHIYEGGY